MATTITGCDTRRDIIDNDAVLWVRFEMDWSQSNLTERNGASVWFFPHDGSRPTVKLTHSDRDSVKLSKGDYSVLVFNETVSDHDYIRFRGTDRYETFEAYAKPITPSARYSKADSDPTASAPNILAVARLEKFTVTREMLSCDTRPTLSFTPQCVITFVTLTIHLNGVENIAASGSALSLSGMAEGLSLATGAPTRNTVTHLAVLGERRFDEGSTTNGTLTARFNSFGLLNTSVGSSGSRNIITLYLRMRGKLPNGSYDLDPIEVDITGIINEFEVGGDIYISEEIQIPDEIPDVPDENNPDPDSGFDADVKDWGPPVITEIPI